MQKASYFIISHLLPSGRTQSFISSGIFSFAGGFVGTVSGCFSTGVTGGFLMVSAGYFGTFTGIYGSSYVTLMYFTFSPKQ